LKLEAVFVTTKDMTGVFMPVR